MAHDGHAGVALDRTHQLVAAARDDEVDEAVLIQQRGDLVARLHRLHEVARQARAAEGLGDEAREHGGRVRRLAAALENGGVARLDGERGNVHHDLGARLEDAEQHADGAGDAVQVECAGGGRGIGEAARVGAVVERRGQRGDAGQARQQLGPLAGLAEEVEARDERARQRAGLDGGVGGLRRGQLRGSYGGLPCSTTTAICSPACPWRWRRAPRPRAPAACRG
jgi:hypothetical protein